MSSFPTTPLAVTLQDAITWTANWRDAKHKARSKAKAFCFSPDEIMVVINQPGTVRVRFYLGLNINEKTGIVTEKMICVGVDEKGHDMLPRLNEHGKQMEGTGDGEIYDFSHPCPDACDEKSPLN
jgi:hypothetical protein